MIGKRGTANLVVEKVELGLTMKRDNGGCVSEKESWSKSPFPPLHMERKKKDDKGRKHTKIIKNGK